MDMGMQV